MADFSHKQTFKNNCCSVGTIVARLVHLLLGWCTCCSVGALLALASGKAERRQVHLLKLAASVPIRAIRGRIISARTSVRSVDSMGEYTQQVGIRVIRVIRVRYYN